MRHQGIGGHFLSGRRWHASIACLIALTLSAGAAQGVGMCTAPWRPGSGLLGGGLEATILRLLVDSVQNGVSTTPVVPPPARPLSCMPAEPASQAGAALPQLVGNPVDLATGVKLDRAIDVHLPSPAAPTDGSALFSGQGLALTFSRLYASASGGSQALGPGWRHGFQTRLHAIAQAQGPDRLLVQQADGRSVEFGPATGGRHVALQAEDGVLEAPVRAGPQVWTWHWRDGRRLRFAADGRLLRIDDGDQALLLEYDANGEHLVAVRDAGGRTLRLDYDLGPLAAHPGRLVALRLPDGTRVHYDYDVEGRLVGVRHGDREALRYRYASEGSARLAAVILPDGRVSDYRYDRQGRVVATRAAGAPLSDTLRLRYLPGTGSDRAGSTEVLIRSAVVGRYDWRALPGQGQDTRVLVAAQGPGCAACPRTGLSYQYDGALLSAVQRDDGAHWRLERDARGRLLRVRARGEQASALFSIDWDTHPVLDRPLRVRRASVVSGRQHVLEVLYPKADGQLRLRESGFAPVFEPAPDGGLRRVAVQPIRREFGLGERPPAEDAPSSALVRLPEQARPLEPGLWLARAANGAQTRFWLDDFGRTVAVVAADTGASTWQRDAQGRLLQERLADGSLATVSRDAEGLVSQHRVERPGVAPVITRFSAPAPQLLLTEQLGQAEERRFDALGRLSSRTVRLRLHSGQVLSFRQDFIYHGQSSVPAGRSLPDGSWLQLRHETHGSGLRLERRVRSDAPANALVDVLARGPEGVRSARYGDGSVLQVAIAPDGRPSRRCLRSAQAADGQCDLLDHRLFFDASGRLLEWLRQDRRDFNLYDSAGRLLQVIERVGTEERVWRQALDANGNRLPAAWATNRSMVRTQPSAPSSVAWDAAGRVVRDGTRSYLWNAMGLLEEVRDSERLLARYRYDHRGQRIGSYADGRWQYHLYDEGRRLLADLDEHGTLLRQYVYLNGAPLAVIDGTGDAQRLSYLHLDHRRAPVLATDAAGRAHWRASYEPFGRLRDLQVAGDFQLALRLAGQVEDAATGLHYNDHRWYDPQAGRYLSPDPIGWRGGPNPYAYADNDPLTRLDPSGLLLFAFDGTGNSDPPPARDDWSNVYKFSQAYADGRVWYMAGVGRPDGPSGINGGPIDPVDAGSARRRVDHMLQALAHEAGQAQWAGRWLDVDIVGFSRGAAMARDFANRVADGIATGRWEALGSCVRLRFLGLWDTVAQFGVVGIRNDEWRLTVPAQVQYAAHAVALHEHRVLFPAESILGGMAGGTRIERGFIGSHSDVGGSYAEGDLSDVALGWMHLQARQAGVRMFALSPEFARVTSPWLHDVNYDSFGDRAFRVRDVTGVITGSDAQRWAPVGGLNWSEAQPFITRLDRPMTDAYGQPSLVGTVGMEDYARWLAKHYGLQVSWSN